MLLLVFTTIRFTLPCCALHQLRTRNHIFRQSRHVREFAKGWRAGEFINRSRNVILKGGCSTYHMWKTSRRSVSSRQIENMKQSHRCVNCFCVWPNTLIPPPVAISIPPLLVLLVCADLRLFAGREALSIRGLLQMYSYRHVCSAGCYFDLMPAV